MLDLQVSVSKISKNLVLAENGQVFNMETSDDDLGVKQIQLPDRIKDIGLAHGGLVYVNEKGEVFLACPEDSTESDPLM